MMVWYISAYMHRRMMLVKERLSLFAHLCFRHWFTVWFINCCCNRCTIKRMVLLIKAHESGELAPCMFDDERL